MIRKLFAKLVLAGLPAIAMVLGYFFYYEYRFKSQGPLAFGRADLAIGAKSQFALALAKEPYKVFLAGDSRALYSLVPAVFREQGLPAYNIACQACELTGFWNAFKALELGKRVPIFVISVSAFQMNDGAEYLALESIYRMKTSERLRIFGIDYFQRAADTFGALLKLDHFKDVAATDPSGATDSAHLGYSYRPAGKPIPIDTPPSPCVEKFITEHPWYLDLNLKGARNRIFREVISEMAQTDNYFILYNAPANHHYRYCLKGRHIETAERTFAQEMKEMTKGHKNILFIDFFEGPEVPGLTINGYSDPQHFNDEGARAFSKYLAGIARQQFSSFRANK